MKRSTQPRIPTMPSAKSPAQWVDPLIDSASSRWIFFSSACRPFALVNLSPDTDIAGAWGSSYLYHSETICGFSHVHAWQLAAVLVMPVCGDHAGGPDVEAYRSRFTHADEVCEAGYHAVSLLDHGVRAELTSTARVGVHRYTFAAEGDATVLLNLGGELGPCTMSGAFVELVGERELAGYVVNAPTRRRPKEAVIHFVVQFSKPLAGFDGWQGENRVADGVVEGRDAGCRARFQVAAGEQLVVKVAISYCSVENARLNLAAECDHWDFDRVRAESQADWDQALGRIEIEGAEDRHHTKLYTDLWHSLLGRRLVSDVNGQYMDRTGPEPIVRRVPLDETGRPAYHHFNSDAFWGAQWTLNTLWTLVCPDHVREMVNCLLDHYRNGGLIPRGPSGGNYTFVMTGASSTPFVVAAYMHGIGGFDAELAYEGLRKNHFPGGLMSKAGYEHDTCIGGGIEHYIEHGFAPDGRKQVAFHVKGAGQTLEYAYQDWCLAQFALALGKQDDYELFMERAGNYRNLFDQETGFIRPRLGDGSWLTPFDPFSEEGFVEANAWQDTWFVPHDLPGLAQLFGGADAAASKLNQAFEMAAPANFAAQKQGGHGPVPINYGNQPSTQTAHVFNYFGKPWLSQKWARAVKEQTQGGTSPDLGYRGDEDQGLMGSLGVLLAIGLFQMKGGADQDPIYEITSPAFERVTIHLDGGDFVISAMNQGQGNIYIQSAELDGKPLERCWIRRSELVGGGTLRLLLGLQPNCAWGSAPELAPPAMSALAVEPAGRA
ncbi:MAG: glycoside hydrolase family 92 protein [Victivallales bacterium]|nr:glycoside hydrolase family 92 protein [Victivallales bacterium]